MIGRKPDEDRAAANIIAARFLAHEIALSMVAGCGLAAVGPAEADAAKHRLAARFKATADAISDPDLRQQFAAVWVMVMTAIEAAEDDVRSAAIQPAI